MADPSCPLWAALRAYRVALVGSTPPGDPSSGRDHDYPASSGVAGDTPVEGADLRMTGAAVGTVVGGDLRQAGGDGQSPYLKREKIVYVTLCLLTPYNSFSQAIYNKYIFEGFSFVLT